MASKKGTTPRNKAAARKATEAPDRFGVKMVRGRTYTYRGKKFHRWQCYVVTREVRDVLVLNRSGYFIDVDLEGPVSNQPIPVVKHPPKHRLTSQHLVRRSPLPVPVTEVQAPVIEEVEFTEAAPEQIESQFSDDLPDDPDFAVEALEPTADFGVAPLVPSPGIGEDPGEEV